MKKVIKVSVYLLLVLLLTWAVKNYGFQRTIVDGDSMENSLHNGDNLIVEEFTGRTSGYHRFDIVVFPFRYEEGVYYIKRIIGLPGETIQIKDGAVYINGNKLNESYGKEMIMDGGIASETMILGKDEYFVLGDNRNDSMDSRTEAVGNIKEKDIVGKAVLRILPLDDFGTVK